VVRRIDWPTGDVREQEGMLAPQQSGVLALGGLDRLVPG
jgi:hypothetical protein